MLKKPDNWLRLGFTLLVFWVVLILFELILSMLAQFNLELNSTVARLGYITSMRGLLLLFTLVTVAVMTALLRRGLVIAPALWLAQLVRLTWFGPGFAGYKNIIFVSDWLNFIVLLLVPILLALLLWQSMERFDSGISLGKLVVPGLWILLVALTSVSSLFVWHWSGQFSGISTPNGYGLILIVVGAVVILMGAARHPVLSLLMFFSGLSVPAIMYMGIWGWYEGFTLAIVSFLPFGSTELMQSWLELMLLIVLPLLLTMVVHQYSAWRRGEKLMEII